MSQQTPAKKLFDLLLSRDFDPDMLDVTGKPASDPAEAELFSFDFRAQSGKDYGTVVIMLGNDGELEIFCADNVGRTMEGEDKSDWFAFLQQLKEFAVRNFMSFGIKNINKLRYSMQGQAAIKEGLFESWSGNRTTSWLGQATEARLMVKHKRPLGENDARYRYVESLYIETADGERFKLPFTKLSGGRAMVEHVRQGGKPYDLRGQHIVGIVEEINVLSRFRRANHNKIFEGDTVQLVEETNLYYENLQKVLKGISSGTGYSNYFESWQPAEVTEQDVVIEGLKNLFVEQNIDSRIEQALPLLARIQQQGQAMKEANIFEAWANRLVEGTWSVPDTPEKQEQLIKLMQSELPVGADATNATEELYDLLGDDVLFDQLQNLADQDANADCRELVFLRMQELSDHPDVSEVVSRLDVDADYAMNPPEPTNPSDVEQGEQEQEVKEGLAVDANAKSPTGSQSAALAHFADQLDHDESVREDISASLETILKHAGIKINENVTLDENGNTFQHILNTFKRDVKDFEANGELTDALYDVLYDYYFDDMPYGTKKARDGDPYEWIGDRFAADLGIDEGMVIATPSIEETGMDYAQEDSAAHNVDGGMSNPLLDLLQDDSTCNMTEAGQMCPVHGIQECWGAPVQSAIPGVVPTLENVEIPDLGLVRMQQLAGFMIK